MRQSSTRRTAPQGGCRSSWLGKQSPQPPRQHGGNSVTERSQPLSSPPGKAKSESQITEFAVLNGTRAEGPDKMMKKKKRKLEETSEEKAALVEAKSHPQRTVRAKRRQEARDSERKTLVAIGRSFPEQRSVQPGAQHNYMLMPNRFDGRRLG